jgi:hypothetical protein
MDYVRLWGIGDIESGVGGVDEDSSMLEAYR